MSSKFTGLPEPAINNLPHRTAWFDERELRLMVAAFRKNDSTRTLLAEFEAALDARIKHKLGIVEAKDSKRDPVE